MTTPSARKYGTVTATTKGFDPADPQFGWPNTFPEMGTRPLVIDELKRNRRLRRRVFFALNVILNASRIPEVDTATHITGLCYDHHLALIEREFIKELEAKDPRIWNQLVSMFRNLRYNLDHPKGDGIAGPHFVRRKKTRRFAPVNRDE